MEDGNLIGIRHLTGSIPASLANALTSVPAAPPMVRPAEDKVGGILVRRPITAGERKLAFALAGLLLLMGAVATPFANRSLPAIPGFVVAYATALLLLDLLVAGLLICKSGIEGDANHLKLSLAYLFTGPIVLLHLLAFPDALLPGTLIGVSASATWLWLFWHTGFAVLVTSYCLRFGIGPPPRLLGTLLWAALLVTVFGGIALFDVRGLPTILVGNRYFLGATGIIIKVTVLALNATAVIAVISRFRLRTPEGLWLAVGATGALVDVWLGCVSGHRFGVGWYLGRLGGLASVFVMLISLVNDVLVMYRNIIKANGLLDKLTLTDVLTELGNRRLFDKVLDNEWRRCRRDFASLAVVMIDVDNFKAYNDTYGHQAGDSCLQQIGAALARSVSRPGDIAVRYGGEEFALILPATDCAGAEHLARLILLRVRDQAMPHVGSPRGIVTISAGIASLVPSENFAASELVRLADMALYRAKAAGRDTIAIAG